MKISKIILTMIVLAMVFATHFFINNKNTKQVIIIIDNSLSMGSKVAYLKFQSDLEKNEAIDSPEKFDFFERAQKHALDIVYKSKDISSDISVDIYQTVGENPNIISTSITDNKVPGIIKRMKPIAGAESFMPAFEKILSSLKESLLSKPQVYIITDCEATLWRNDRDIIISDEFEQMFNDLCSKTKVHVVNVMNPNFKSEDNVVLSPVIYNNNLFSKVTPINVSIGLENKGFNMLDAELNVSLSYDPTGINDQFYKVFEIAEDGNVNVQVSLAAEDSGYNFLHASIKTYNLDLSFDNNFYEVINVRKHINILNVENSQNPMSFDKLFQALTKSTLTNDHDKDYYNWTNSPNLENTDGYDIILLNDKSEINDKEIELLSNFVKNGGQVLIVAAEDIKADGFNNLLKNLNYNETSFAEKLSFDKNIGFEDLTVKKSLIDAIKGIQECFEDVTFKSYNKLILGKEAEIFSMMNFSDNNPFLVNLPCGSGNLVLITTSLEGNNSNFLSKFKSFPIFVDRLFSRLLIQTVHTPQYLSQLSQKTLGIPGRAKQIKIKSYNSDEEFSILKNNTFQLENPGFYLLSYELDGKQIEKPIAVNFPRSKNNTGYLGPESLKSTFTEPPYFIYKELDDYGNTYYR